MDHRILITEQITNRLSATLKGRHSPYKLRSRGPSF
jgi:hypothetical protein